MVLLACVLNGVSPLRAQDQVANAAVSAPIVTDRPSVTDSSIVVPAGSIQAENGLLDNSTQAVRTLDGPETLVRFGLLPKTELRFYGSELLLQREQRLEHRHGARLGIRRLGHRSVAATRPHVTWI
jgi:hypothetical protein